MKSFNTHLAALMTMLCISFNADAQLFEYLFSSGGCGLWQSKLVTVKQGTMRGSTFKTEKGKPYCVFQGIPYSQPPVGQYRFQPPRPPVPWKGILDATEERASCIQYSFVAFKSIGQEDCLYMNIVTPALKPKDGKFLDVMVWFYGGNFHVGTSSVVTDGPEYLLEKDVLTVHFNYRLGAFGFLSTGDDEAPGNYGMKDQVAALQWVQDNIAAFGGNASSVTIFGLSSGASCVHYQILSPLSQGLFHRAISLEGTAINAWARCPNPLQQAKKQAYILGCPTEPTSCLVSCLKEMDAEKLSDSLYYMFSWLMVPNSGYAPVSEKLTERNPYPFITDDPVSLLRDGKFRRIPWLLGGANEDAAIFLAAFFNMKVALDKVNGHIEDISSKVLQLYTSVPQERISEMTSRALTHYLGSVRKISEDNISEITKMFNDRMFTHGYHNAMKLHALAGHTQVYRYNFAYRGKYSVTMATSLKNYGIAHADETFLIFRRPTIKYSPGDYDLEVRDFMVTLLTNFAKYGNPTPDFKTGNYLIDELKFLPIVDQDPDFTHLRYLNIGQVITAPQLVGYGNLGLGAVKLNMAEDLYQERVDFWESLPLSENCLPNCNEKIVPRCS